ncbi:zinc-finger-containing protein [Leisingera sp. SS27]|uniref:zinc-finger-containing protein n=1 Tax=Leisingera sp. SS27 TaxID=2979462 RepID=UPI00232DD868|nr:zinc-finger-containing protein [Leisingera sp. SS27]MDC0657086.1 zinc-finger-containing protein [Leisingera sp. SS27]
MTREIYCCGCSDKVPARLTDGAEIYPHRRDLSALPFWKCDTCGNHVGCHHKTSHPTTPLGCIPTPEIKSARQHIHRILDPIWKKGRMTRRAVYAEVAERLGRKDYHTANIRSVDEARQVYRIVKEIGAQV